MRRLSVASQSAETSAREVAFDRLPEAGPSLEVLLLDNVTFHADDECGPFRPHRHDYHELIWTREGEPSTSSMERFSLVEPNEITLSGEVRWVQARPWSHRRRASRPEHKSPDVRGFCRAL